MNLDDWEPNIVEHKNENGSSVSITLFGSLRIEAAKAVIASLHLSGYSRDAISDIHSDKALHAVSFTVKGMSAEVFNQKTKRALDTFVKFKEYAQKLGVDFWNDYPGYRGENQSRGENPVCMIHSAKSYVAPTETSGGQGLKVLLDALAQGGIAAEPMSTGEEFANNAHWIEFHPEEGTDIINKLEQLVSNKQKISSQSSKENSAQPPNIHQ